MKQHCKRVKAEATDILRPASEITVTSATLHWPKGHRARPDLRGGELVRHHHSRARAVKKLQPS